MVNGRIHTVRAPNPSAMTLTGTNSYVIDAGGDAICIDPGPAMSSHIDTIVRIAGQLHARIALICVTHGHPDHAPGAQLLQRATGAPIAAHAIAEFPHDRDVRDGDRLHAGNVTLLAIDAPGHTFDHLVFYEAQEGALFTGDVVLGEGSVVIAPPGGAMRPYQRTLQRLLDEFPDARTIYGGHGPPVTDPQQKLRDYIAHRRYREEELLAALAQGPQTIPQLVERIYRDTNPILWPAAARQLLAYLVALEQEGRVRSEIVARDLNAHEHAILNPEWSTIVNHEEAAVIEEELGAMLRMDSLRRYSISRTILPN
jgi:glyoxylase-like metal-dependent hydrolase (beta-lactamase superfamily II)